MNAIDYLADAKRSFNTVGFVDDFIGLDTTRWSTLVADGGTVAEDQDGLGGVVTLATDGTADNDETYMFTNEIVKYLNGKPFMMGFRVQYAEADTNKLNVMIGVGEGFGAADTIQNDGAGPKADYDGVCLFKVDGGTRWNFESSMGTTQVTTELNVTAGGSSWLSGIIYCEPLNSAEMAASVWLDTTGGSNLVQALPYLSTALSARPFPPVKHRFAYTTAGEMAVFFGIKCGSATAETLNVDLAMFQAVR